MTKPGIQPRVGAGLNVRIPDLAVTCSPILLTDKLMHEPILIIEILSPSNHAETWANVWSYTTIATVRQIAVVHVALQRIDLLVRQPDGLLPDNPETIIAPGHIRFASIGFEHPVAGFYRTVA